jgi:YhcH/YjgK/YiaL family protein
MITDHLANGHRYTALGPRIARAIAFLQQTDLAATAEGRYDLEGSDCYALVQHYTSKPLDQGKWEAHRLYADLQYVVSGTERMGYGLIERFTRGDYDAAKDFEVLTGVGDFLLLQAGEFVLLWPGEVHMPQMAVDAPAAVKKVVVKIRT